MHTQTLQLLIERSVLLTDEKRQELRAVLNTLSEAQIETLSALLSEEAGITDGLIQHAIDTVIERSDPEEIAEVDTALQTSQTTLRKVEEESDQIDESDTLTHLFDDAA